MKRANGMILFVLVALAILVPCRPTPSKAAYILDKLEKDNCFSRFKITKISTGHIGDGDKEIRIVNKTE